nr:MAG TPA: hypothetical protein [Caudoviricetes sp.]
MGTKRQLLKYSMTESCFLLISIKTATHIPKKLSLKILKKFYKSIVHPHGAFSMHSCKLLRFLQRLESYQQVNNPCVFNALRLFCNQAQANNQEKAVVRKFRIAAFLYSRKVVKT